MNFMNRTAFIPLLISLMLVVPACNPEALKSDDYQKKCALTGKALIDASMKIRGACGRTLPPGFNSKSFLDTLKKYGEPYYSVLKDYDLIVISNDSNYLAIVRDRCQVNVTMYDVSNTSKLDGPLYEDSTKYLVEDILNRKLLSH